jgi:hypothetical protein
MNSALRSCRAKSARPTLKALIHSLPGLTSLLHKLAMQFQTPYVDWTPSISTLHYLMHGEDWGMFPTSIGDKYLTANPRQIYADARVYYSSHFVRKRLEQATAAAIAAAVIAAAVSAASASIKPIAVGLDEDSVGTATIAPCADADADVDDVECNAWNTPQTLMDITPPTEIHATQQSNVEHVCNLQQPTFNAIIATSLDTNRQIAQCAIAMHLPQCRCQCRRQRRESPHI